MGWWTVEGTNDVIGDPALDVLGDAVSAVVREYEQDLGRKPTRGEWEALLLAVLGNRLPEFRCMDEGTVSNVRLEG